jgi:hypothetical protein
MRILEMSHLPMWTIRTIALVFGNEVRLTSWTERVMGM